MGHSVEEINQHVKTYLKVFGALLVLTGLTVAVSYLDVSMGMAIFIAMVIAATKGTLVTAFFMHFKDDVSHKRKWVVNSMILTAFFFVFMVVVILLTDGTNVRM